MNSENEAFKQISMFNELAGNPKKARRLNSTLPSLYMRLIDEEFSETAGAYDDSDEVEVIDGLADLVVVAVGMMLSLGYDPDELMREVNSSNLSKFCTTQEDADETVASYADDPRYTDVHCKQVGNLYVILGRVVGGDGWKILKNKYYVPANFKKFVENKYKGEVEE